MVKPTFAPTKDEKWLLVDIGNTALSFQGFEKGQFSNLFSIIHRDIPKNLKKIALSGLINSNTQIVIVSVVPKITSLVKKIFGSTRAKKIWVIDENLPVKFSHKYRKYNKLGADRKINIFGAMQLYGGPCVIMSFGTAVTVDYISKHDIYEGGFIIPGPQTALSSLGSKAALLPENLTVPRKIHGFLGRDTQQCMINGIIVGYASILEGLALQFLRRYGPKVQFIITGGFADRIVPLVPSFGIYDPGHTLRSLALAALAHTAQKVSY